MTEKETYLKKRKRLEDSFFFFSFNWRYSSTTTCWLHGWSKSPLAWSGWGATRPSVWSLLFQTMMEALLLHLHFLSSAFRRKSQCVESRQHMKWRPHDEEDVECCSIHIQTTKRKRRGLRMLETLNYEISNLHSIILLERSQGSLYKHTITQIHLHTHIWGWNDNLHTYWHGKHNPTTLHSGCHVNNVYNPNPSPFLCWVLRIVSFYFFPPHPLLWHALTVEFCL